MWDIVGLTEIKCQNNFQVGSQLMRHFYKHGFATYMRFGAFVFKLRISYAFLNCHKYILEQDEKPKVFYLQ